MTAFAAAAWLMVSPLQLARSSAARSATLQSRSSAAACKRTDHEALRRQRPRERPDCSSTAAQATEGSRWAEHTLMDFWSADTACSRSCSESSGTCRGSRHSLKPTGSASFTGISSAGAASLVGSVASAVAALSVGSPASSSAAASPSAAASLSASSGLASSSTGGFSPSSLMQ